jgi:competence protein ComEC
MKEIISYINGRVKKQIDYYLLPKSLVLILFFVAFLVGIFIGDLYFCGDFMKLGFVLVLLNVLVKKFLRVNREVFLLILVGTVLGIGRLYFANLIDEKDISHYLGKGLLKACISEEVDVRNDKIKYTVEAFEFQKNGKIILVNGRALVTGGRYPVYEYGDCLLIDGELQKPDVIEDFDYGQYLSRYRIYAVIYQAEIKKIDKEFGLLKMVFGFKVDFEARISRIFAEPHAGFMAGLLLGSRRGISEELTQKFNITGLSHIVAVSGYNITMLIVIVSGLFGFLGRKRKVIASAIMITLFVVLVGAGASVVRAAIMGGVGLLALWFGRSYFVSISLFTAAFFMNLLNPLIMLNDVGFQLSFLATCGLVYVSPLIEKYFVKLPEFFGIRESMTMTISAQVLALPIILLNFGRLSLISPLANVFVLPFLPASMFFGFLAVVFGCFSSALSLVFGFVAYLIMNLIIILVRFFAAVPLASTGIGWFNFWVAGMYYFIVVWWIMANNRD